MKIFLLFMAIRILQFIAMVLQAEYQRLSTYPA